MSRPVVLSCAIALIFATTACAQSPTDAADATPPTTTPTAEPAPATQPAPAGFDAVLAGSWRDPKNVARDQYRHPRETLEFFGVKPTDTVIEITPGGGWYMEILAPYLRDSGAYVAAIVDPMSVPEGKVRDSPRKGKADLEARFASAPAQYDHATIGGYDPKAPAFAKPGTADVVLTFRNVHNWRSSGQAESMFKGFFDALKPGGTLGVVEHRAKADVPADDKTGYVGEAQVIAMAEAAGFKLDAKSDVNANPKDTKDHPNGVWTLPPVNDHDAEDDAKYKAIGESDRMTLRFKKPRVE